MRLCVICLFLCLVFRSSVASKSSDACKTFGSAPPVEISLTNRVNLGEFPEAVALGYVRDNKTSFSCNGVLISEKFVLTVASCVDRRNRVPKFVRLGKTSIKPDDAEDPSVAVDVVVKSITKHLDYNSRKRLNNIALIQLEEKVTFTDKVRPACLNSDSSSAIRDLVQIGWGRGVFNRQSIQRSQWLLKNNVTEIRNAECREIFNEFAFTYVDSHLCAENEKSDEICQGSTGSFLGTVEGDNHVVHGLTSFGSECGKHIPAGFTRVASYIEWIENIVWP